jgi:hypothetical protein
MLYSSPKGSIVQVLSKSNQGIAAEFVNNQLKQARFNAVINQIDKDEDGGI